MEAVTTPVFQLPRSADIYLSDYETLLRDARDAAAAAGFRSSSYDLDCVYCGLGFAWNLAHVGTTGAWLSSLDPGTACHEFGHNFGLQHANAWSTSDFTTIGAGKNARYGNFFDTMGNGTSGSYPFGAYEKHLLGWIPDSGILTVISSGIYRVNCVDADTFEVDSQYGLRVNKDSTRDYWVELRQSQQDPQLRTGVLLYWSPWEMSEGGTELLDCSPGTYKEPTLQVGRTFYDLEKGLKIAPLRVNQTSPPSVDLQVEVIQTVTGTVRLTRAHSGNKGGGSQSLLIDSNVSDRLPSSGTLSITVPADGSYALWVQTSGKVQPSRLASDHRLG